MASAVRGSHADRELRPGSGAEQDAKILPREPTEDRRESRGSPPVESVRRSPLSAPDELGRILQSKGFAGGVPLNTERTTVKPWVGIAR